MAEPADGAVWAMTCYFNPAGYRSRLETYRQFRRRLNVPLVTVELSFDGTFQLKPDDTTILLQVQGGDVMWQKERLLNLGLALVPRTCDKIAWLDCDVVFARDDWAHLASRALDEYALVHLFQERYDLPRNGTPDQYAPETAPGGIPSMVYQMVAEGVPPGDLLLSHPTLKRVASNGLAWASRRDVLETHGLYDACILGSGDRAVLCAALGTFDFCTRALLMNERREAHYLAWARPYFETVRGRIGYIDGRAFHLWHGEVKDRQYGARDRAFEGLAFDPYRDIALAPNGCWRWSSDKRELHEFVRRYFASRNEDGL